MPHPEALENLERAYIPEGKIRYALRDPNKRRPFAALGFSEEAGNWEELRNAVVESLPYQPAEPGLRDEYGQRYSVKLSIRGLGSEEAPVTTGWIYDIGEDYPRLITIYIDTDKWRRQQRQ